jgi:hypothetical protein
MESDQYVEKNPPRHEAHLPLSEYEARLPPGVAVVPRPAFGDYRLLYRAPDSAKPECLYIVFETVVRRWKNRPEVFAHIARRELRARQTKESGCP